MLDYSMKGIGNKASATIFIIEEAILMPRKKTTAASRAAQRTKNFATIVYPESAAVDWQEQLQALHTPVLVSPLHNMDTNPDGTRKKAHYHVLIMFTSVKDYENQVKPIFAKIGGVGREEVQSTRGYARYLIHADNPEKYQYDATDVTAYGGADYAALIHTDADEDEDTLDIMAYCQDNEIYSMAELISILRQEGKKTWLSLIIRRKAYIISTFLKSLVWEKEKSYIRKADRTPSTEVLAPTNCYITKDGKVVDADTGEIVGNIVDRD